jgi:hypothetical protein
MPGSIRADRPLQFLKAERLVYSSVTYVPRLWKGLGQQRMETRLTKQLNEFNSCSGNRCFKNPAALAAIADTHILPLMLVFRSRPGPQRTWHVPDDTRGDEKAP